MIERIIQIRKEQGLSQEEFAKRLNLSRNFINQVETGKKNVSDRTLADICSKFGINEAWLKYGEGQMHTTPVDGALGNLIKGFDCTNFEAEFLKSYFRMTVTERMEFMKYALKLFGPVLKNTVWSGLNPFAPASADEDEPWTAERYHQMVDEHLVIEKEPGAGSGASSSGESDTAIGAG